MMYQEFIDHVKAETGERPNMSCNGYHAIVEPFYSDMDDCKSKADFAKFYVVHHGAFEAIAKRLQHIIDVETSLHAMRCTLDNDKQRFEESRDGLLDSASLAVKAIEDATGKARNAYAAYAG